ncbi:MAG TPA: hypothetical protein VJ843_00980 [Candidatus Saccharimonadales bacterium]|nr:hypothetical protein [Candidatus Saccharimonadales bacterium]
MKGLGQNTNGEQEQQFNPQSFKRFLQYEFTLTLYGFVGFVLLVALPVGLLWNPVKFWGLYTGTAIGLCVVLLATIAARAVQLSLSRRNREQILRAYAQRHSYAYGVANQHEFVDTLGVIAETAVDYSDFALKNTLTTPHWTYSDFAYLRRGNPTYGSPTLWRVNYGLISVELPRQLPNMFFDSKNAFGSQFKQRIDQRYAHSLESYFDEHFTAYFSQDDSNTRALITPEVMIALLEAEAYDIEIYGNRVFLYGAPVRSIAQLEDMAEKAKKIGTALTSHLNAYHDQRLSVDDGRLSVLSEAKLLNQGSFWATVALLLVGLYMLPYAVMFVQIMYVWTTQGWSAASGLY